MSLKSKPTTVVPEDTARVAKAVFKKGNRYVMLRDTFGDLFDIEGFTQLFSHEGKPALDPARLALITVVQFAEKLSDEAAMEQVRSRIDLKYLLALPLEDPGFDASVLSEFRTRLVAGNAEALLFDTLLVRFRQHKLLRTRGQQRTDSTHVLAAVNALNRLELVSATIRHALNALATEAPDWLTLHLQPEWLERYATRFLEGPRLLSHEQRTRLGNEVGADGLCLLQAVVGPEAPIWLGDLRAVQLLRLVWLQNYTWATEGGLRWRGNDEIPSARQFISSPFDADARLSAKYTTAWVGYKAFLTETCDGDLPHLITNVETTKATTGDFEVTAVVHDHLEERKLTPQLHLIDSGFITAGQLLEATERHSISLVGPARMDQQWQARAKQGFAAQDFQVDFDQQQAICPEGRKSISWTQAKDKQQPVVKVKFSMTDCQACPSRNLCTKAKRRSLTLRHQAKHDSLVQQRAWQETPEFRQIATKRAGIEGTISQGVRAYGLRHARYRGLPKTRLQHLATGSAINLQRVADWLTGKQPEQTRQAPFTHLYGTSA